MGFLARLTIGPRVYGIVTVLAVVAAVIGGLGMASIYTYQQQSAAIEAAGQRTALGERVNGLVYAVVMDSRGVYMARDAKEANKFGQPLLKQLERIDVLMREWDALVTPTQRTSLPLHRATWTRRSGSWKRMSRATRLDHPIARRQ